MGRGHKYVNKHRNKFNFKPKSTHHISNPREYTPKKSLKEDEVGITEFVSKCDGFTGVLKARFSDFHVNEIDLDGNIIVLSNQIAPKPATEVLGTVKLEKNKKELENVLTPDVWKQIDKLLIGIDMTASVDIDVTKLEKEKRTSIHKTLKEIYGNKIISTTDAVGENKFISCSKSNGGKGDGRTRWTWAQEYVYFVVHKENTDTVQAASDMALALRIPPSAVNYAGTKDKRAKTTQRFCVKKREPAQILKCSRRFPYLKVGNFEFKDTVLKLGDLKGNRFRIALRHVNGDQEKISKSLEDMKENGFINYYGLQRFGNSSTIPTYQVGIALLKGDYKEAVELILKPREGDPYFLKDARETWWKNRNSSEAASMINNHKFIEKKLWDGLAKFGENDYANSLRRIPRNMLLLYTHSYQSLIWNKIASKKIALFGLNIIVGDLVFRDKNAEENSEIIETTEEIIESADVFNESDIKEEDDISAKQEEDAEKTSIFKQKVRPVTEEDILSGKYTIYDIVLPLPGHDITYPSNEVKIWYEELLAEHDLSSEKLKHNVKTYSLTGAYRKLFLKPENMSWELKHYDLPTSVLIASDYEKMKNRKADEDKIDGDFKALLLDFCLPSAAYATMALREILKADTSSMNQAKIEDTETKKFEEYHVLNEEETNKKRKTLETNENSENKKIKIV